MATTKTLLQAIHTEKSVPNENCLGYQIFFLALATGYHQNLFFTCFCGLKMTFNVLWIVVVLLPPATKLGQGYIFTGVCDSVHRGAACMAGGHACCEVCMAGGGMHGRGHAWLGACMVGGMHDMHAPPGRHYSYGIWSMSGRYASY